MFHIIIPTYNRKNKISRAIDSILNQVFIEKLLIYIIDDGSTDLTKNFIGKKYGDNNNILYFYKKNGGVGSARNFGLKKVLENGKIGDLILFLDSDDKLKNNALNNIYKVTKNFSDVFYFAFGAENESGKKTFFNNIDNQILSYKESLSNIKANGEFFRVIKLDVFIKNNFYFPIGLNGGEDIFRLEINKKYNLLVSNIIVRVYYQDDTGITREILDDKKILNFKNVTKLFIEKYGNDLFLENKRLLGLHFLVLARMYALSNNKILSINYGIKGFIFSHDIFRFFLYLISLMPFGIYLNNILIKLKK